MINKRLIIVLSIVVILLLIPLVAMQFDSGANWSLMDFVKMGLLLFGAGILCEIVLRKVKTIKYRVIICLAILIIFFLIWAELAVGIFGTPFAGS